MNIYYIKVVSKPYPKHLWHNYFYCSFFADFKAYLRNKKLYLTRMVDFCIRNTICNMLIKNNLIDNKHIRNMTENTKNINHPKLNIA